MYAHRSRRTLFSLGLLPFVVATAVAIAAVSNAAPGSTRLHGHMHDIANFRGPGCDSAIVCSSFTATGEIKGEGIVSVDTGPNADGISQAHTVITTKKGELRCHEAAVFDLTPDSDHAFVDLCLIDGGTGDYDGASGYIQEVGTFDFGANHGELEYYGKLVRATS